MKYLVIPDIHNNTQKADDIIEKVPHDKIIFLGDFFDDFGDSANDALKTAYWLKNKLNNPNFTFIWGNHDLVYRYCQNRFTECPGFSNSKYIAVNGVLNTEDWNKFTFFHTIDEGNFLISHAGLHSFYQDQSIKDFDSLKLWMQNEQIKAFRALRNNEIHWFYKAGFERGGEYSYGGLTWGCHSVFENNSEFYTNICGHSPIKRERRKGNGYFLDSYPALQFYGIIENGQFSIHKA